MSGAAAPQPDKDRVKVKPGQVYMDVGARVHGDAPAEPPSMGIAAPSDGVVEPDSELPPQ